jgi:molybdopterin molybdotransferase
LIDMLSVTEATQRLLSKLPICELETIALQDIFGRVLAEDILAEVASPRFDNSSMDGFAVRAGDTKSAEEAKPVTLKVIGDIPAGRAIDLVLKAGQAMRIMTGAPVPAGADAVVPVEDTDVPSAVAGVVLPSEVRVKRAMRLGEFIRPAGEDFKAGDLLVKAGTRVRPQETALIAMQGMTELRVYRKPRVAILSSGDELLVPGEPWQLGKIRETNSFSLAALVKTCGAEPILLGIAHDTLEDILAHLDKCVDAGADLILSSAGVSVGAFDYLREAVTRNGELDFWKVNMRPGKPFAFGAYRGIPYIGLPGNTVSSFVGFEVFLRPALNQMAGVKGFTRLKVLAALKENASSDGRESFLRVFLDTAAVPATVHLTGHQGSGNLYSLVLANALMHVPAGVTNLSVGSHVEVWPL